MNNCKSWGLFANTIILFFFCMQTASALDESLLQVRTFAPPVRRFSKELLYGLSAVNHAPQKEVPLKLYQNSLSPAATIGQPLIASAFGLATAIVVGYGAGNIAARIVEGSSTDMFFAGLFYGGYLGHIVGSTMGCWHFAKAKNVDGSFEGTLMGSLVGGFAAIGAASATENWAPLLVGPPIGATITFHLTREP